MSNNNSNKMYLSIRNKNPIIKYNVFKIIILLTNKIRKIKKWFYSAIK